MKLNKNILIITRRESKKAFIQGFLKIQNIGIIMKPQMEHQTGQAWDIKLKFNTAGAWRDAGVGVELVACPAHTDREAIQ